MAAAPGAPGMINTDILVDGFRGHADGLAFLGAQRTAGVVQISIVSAMELVAGCRNAAELTNVQQFLQRLTVLPLDPPASLAALGLMEQFFLSHGLLLP